MSTIDASSHFDTVPRPLNADLPADVFKRTLHSANNLVVLTDPNLPDNPIVWVNDHFSAFTGYSREEVIGRNCRFLQGDDRQQVARRVLRERVSEGDFVNVVLRNYKKDGTLFYNDLYVSPVYYEDGALAYFLGVQNDATILEEALQTIRERDQQLHDLVETERERFGMELHEGLGQVLTGAALSAAAHLRELERKAPDFAPGARIVCDLIQRAVAESRQIAEGLHPLLDERAGLIRALHDLATSMDEASEQIRVEARLEDVSLLDHRVTRHLFRIAQEAVANALKHGEATWIAIHLEESSHLEEHLGESSGDGSSEESTPSEGRVCLTIEDNGIGIPAEILATNRAMPTGTRVSEVARLAQHGRGLYSMRLRADQIGAALTIDRRAEGGTRVMCCVATEAS